jgi:hypothetical protein
LALKKEKATSEFKYQVYVTFLELYNEDLVDLLNAYQNQSTKKKGLALCDVQIREDSNKHIYWSGVREEPCDSPDELLQYLAKGSLCRTTGSTDMNSVSSRSHAIFSVILKQQLPEDDQTVPGNSSGRTVTSKFHFVDLAGSERVCTCNTRDMHFFFFFFF